MPHKDPEARKRSSRKYYATHKDQYRAYRKTDAYRQRQPVVSRKAMLLKRYGVSPEDYDVMLAAQSGVCAICSTSEPQGGRKFFCVDHNHTTGRVRALLCHACNILVAYAEHVRLADAQAYLAKYN